MSGISNKLRRRSSALLLTSLAVAAVSASDRVVHAQQSQVSKSYTTPIPEEIFTPDTVKTSAGTFRFFDGMPDITHKAMPDKQHTSRELALKTNQ